MDARTLLALVNEFRESPHELAAQVAAAQRQSSADVAAAAGANDEVVRAIMEAP